jgi:hypothetical protein
MPNWAEQVTAIATAVSALGLLSAIGAVVFAGQQAREARIGRQAATAVDFFRRWDEEPLVATRRLVAQFETPEALRDAMTRLIDRWEVWQPSIDAIGGRDAYPMFDQLVTKMRAAV